MGTAYSGILSMSGEKGGPLFFPMVALGDVSTDTYAAERSGVRVGEEKWG